MADRLTGIYRGIVIDDKDPLNLGRLYISVPVEPGTTGWAMACAPYDGSNSVTTPTVGTNIWVMFEGGDPMYPVWMGWYPTK